MELSSFLEVISGNNTFSIKFYKVLAEKDKGKNILFSPISIHLILSMIYQGAAGITADLLSKSLYLKNPTVAAIGYREVIKSLNCIQNVTLNFANKVYVNEGFFLTEHFKKVTRELFLSEAELVNFENSIIVANNINYWVEEKTNYKILELVLPDWLNELSRIVLVNAIYFSGRWAKPFCREDTAVRQFYVSKCELVYCEMMQTFNDFRYYEDTEFDAKFLIMDYYKKEVSMLIVLPNDINGIDKLNEKIGNLNLLKIIKNMNTVKTNLILPKFKIETLIDLELILPHMGLGIIFDRIQADFSEVSKNPEQIYVSKAVQKAYIEINEEGAEAGAGTGLEVMVCSFSVKEFHADHPFIIFLLHECGEVINTLFIGKINNPLLNK